MNVEGLCNEVKTVGKFTYIGCRVCAGRGFEAAVTVRTGCGWV